MTRLVDLAAERGAKWIIPFDADEIWVSPCGRLADVIRASHDADVLVGDWITHYPIPSSGRAPFDRMPLRDKRPSVHHHKVAFRVLPGLTIQQGNHNVVGGKVCEEGKAV